MSTMLSFSWEDLADTLRDLAPSSAQGEMAARGVNTIRRRYDQGLISSRTLLEQLMALMWVMHQTSADGADDPLTLLADLHQAMTAHAPEAIALALKMFGRTAMETETSEPEPAA